MQEKLENKNAIALYKTADGAFTFEVKIKKDTVWLTQRQMVELFEKNQSVISRHINNIFKEGELEKESVYANFAYTSSDGKQYNVDHYNLDVIISVGYRVKSKRGTQFRIWANKIIKEYLINGYSLNTSKLQKESDKIKNIEEFIKNLSNTIEDKEKKHLIFQIKTDEKIDNIVKRLDVQEMPKQGIFFNGQIFDAYKLVSDIIRSAKKSIILIDNYIDDTVLEILSKRKINVKAEILIQNISKQLKLDLEKHNCQYPKIIVKIAKNFHDRFIIIDNKDVYHFGASLKDLGKKVFGFSKFEKEAMRLIERLDII